MGLKKPIETMLRHSVVLRHQGYCTVQRTRKRYFSSSCFDQFQSLFLGQFFMLIPNLASVFAQDIAFITK